MYFAVILMESKKLLVIPASYVLKLDVVGKINSGLKSYKRQVVFFSPENHYPNFKLPIREDFDESTDGIYMANILKAFDTKEEAESYADLRRNALPVNYYKHRVDHDDLDEATGNESDTDLVVVKREPIRCDSITDTVSPSEHSDAEPFGNISDEDCLDSDSDSVFSISSDDEVEFVSCDRSFGAVEIPQPILIKTEDILTGSEKFTLNENLDRYYAANGVTLRASVVDTLSLWNSTEPWKNEDHDFIFVQFLLIDVFGVKTLAIEYLDHQKLQFVKEIFAYRVNSCERRLSLFYDYVDKVTDQLSHKLMVSDNNNS